MCTPNQSQLVLLLSFCGRLVSESWWNILSMRILCLINHCVTLSFSFDANVHQIMIQQEDVKREVGEINQIDGWLLVKECDVVVSKSPQKILVNLLINKILDACGSVLEMFEITDWIDRTDGNSSVKALLTGCMLQKKFINNRLDISVYIQTSVFPKVRPCLKNL